MSISRAGEPQQSAATESPPPTPESRPSPPRREEKAETVGGVLKGYRTMNVRVLIAIELMARASSAAVCRSADFRNRGGCDRQTAGDDSGGYRRSVPDAPNLTHPLITQALCARASGKNPALVREGDGVPRCAAIACVSSEDGPTCAGSGRKARSAAVQGVLPGSSRSRASSWRCGYAARASVPSTHRTVHIRISTTRTRPPHRGPTGSVMADTACVQAKADE